MMTYSKTLTRLDKSIGGKLLQWRHSSVMASQIIGTGAVCWIACLVLLQGRHRSSASFAFSRGISNGSDDKAGIMTTQNLMYQMPLLPHKATFPERIRQLGNNFWTRWLTLQEHAPNVTHLTESLEINDF